MPASNKKYRFFSAASISPVPENRLGERVRHYAARHPEVSREQFLLTRSGERSISSSEEAERNRQVLARKDKIAIRRLTSGRV